MAKVDSEEAKESGKVQALELEAKAVVVLSEAEVVWETSLAWESLMYRSTVLTKR
jgi:hypothetical protein